MEQASIVVVLGGGNDLMLLLQNGPVNLIDWENKSHAKQGLIPNCRLAFQCPESWSAMQTTADEDIRLCAECKISEQTIYIWRK
jgi:hypothetical protein